MAEKIPERLRWTVETLDLRPADRVLEVGCGPGVAVSLVCERLEGGEITAIDRSEKMIALAERRNRAHVDAGKAIFHAVALRDFDAGDRRFDRVFASNVNVFWQKPARELEVVRRLLEPGGALHLFYQPPAASQTRRIADDVSAILREHGFAVDDVRFAELAPVPVVCIVSRPGA
jgi:ubiquinone/menaquinone biosynthesis C-methylase UbiE